MITEPKTAIIILNWNGYADTVECLESLRKLQYRNYKIVLVDNGSRDQEGRRLKDLFPEVILLQNPQNRGFAGGNNDGINWALANGFEYIVNLNNDCTVELDWLSRLVVGIQQSKADFGSSMILFYDERDRICSDGDLALPDGSGVVEHRNKTRQQGFCSREKIFAACGAGSIYSAACLKAVQIKENEYFDELHFAYYEDIDLGFRLNAKGFQGVIVPDAVVYHKHSKATGVYSEFKLFHSEKNRLLNELLNFPLLWFPFGEFFFFVKVGAMGLRSVFNKNSKGKVYLRHFSVLKILGVFLKARGWVLKNIRLVWHDRLERKQKMMISWKVLKLCQWTLSDTVI
ncbi:MAG: glycosyltransferase family 2 protein [Candidatus Omnitrophica bacterium]|nr:glycosyltransferase family 2 protein [Candidatus Omnitrophota bacterium]